MRQLRAMLFLTGLVVITGVMGVAGLPVLLAPRRAVAEFSRYWAGTVLAWLRVSTGIRYRLRGGERLPGRPVILAIKHQSALETFALNQLFSDPAIICKKELLKIPIFGWYLKRSGVIAIDRAGGAAAFRQMAADAQNAIAAGRSIAIFPEGTRGKPGEKLPYQPGVGLLYAQLGVPLVPIALNTGGFWGLTVLDKRPGTASIEILDPIQPGLDRRTAMRLLEERIETASDRLLREIGAMQPVENSVG